MLLRDYLPTRSPEDVWASQVRLSLGRQEFVVAVLPMAASDRWKEAAGAAVGDLAGGLDSLDSLAAILAHFGAIEREQMLALLHAYDHAGALPDDGWILEHATEGEVLRSFIEVYAVAYPTLAVIVDILVRSPETLTALGAAIAAEATTATTAPASGNGSPSSTDGPPPEPAPS